MGLPTYFFQNSNYYIGHIYGFPRLLWHFVIFWPSNGLFILLGHTQIISSSYLPNLEISDISATLSLLVLIYDPSRILTDLLLSHIYIFRIVLF